MVSPRTIPNPPFSRRSLLAGGGLLLAAPALAACGGGGSGTASGSGPADVLFWSQLAGSKQKAGDALIAAFKKAHASDVKLTVDPFGDPDQLNEKLLTSFAGGTAPDILVQTWTFSIAYAANGQLLDLGPLMSKNGPAASAIDPRVLRYGQFDGKTYSVPLFADCQRLFVNTTIAKQFSMDVNTPPKNWAEMREWAIAMTVRKNGKLQSAGLEIFVEGESAWEEFMNLLYGAGGTVLSDDLAKVTFNSPQGIEALTFLQNLMLKDKVCDPGFAEGGLSQQEPFMVGKAAMTMAGTYAVNNTAQAKIPATPVPIPGMNGGQFTFGDTFVFSIPAKSKNADAAYKLIQFALSSAQQQSFAKTSQAVPVLLEAQTDPGLKGETTLQSFIETFGHAPQHPPVVKAYPMIQNFGATQIEACLRGKITPTQALNTAAQQVQAALG